MPRISDNEWTIIDHTSTAAQVNTMATINDTTSVPAAEHKIDATINTKANPFVVPTDEKVIPACTCEASMPKLERQDSIESFISVDDNFRRPPRRIQQNYIRRYSPSPIGRRRVVYEPTAMFDKSTQFLDAVGKFDGTVDLPRPSRGAVYLTTYPFTDKDVKKWSWLFSLNVEETSLEQSSRGRDLGFDDGEDNVSPTVRRARNNSPWYDPGTIDIPSVYLSRALDTDVVPEETANISYLIVTQNRHRPTGSKLLVAESRKAAGIMMYYEALKGDSTVFVGVVLDFGAKKVHPKKFKKVESLEDAIQAKEQGFMGVIC